MEMYVMDNNKFPEQKAPEKNTDKAFVEVGQDGSPVTPQQEKKKDVEKEERPTTPTTRDER
jgi:hypothetical protein